MKLNRVIRPLVLFLGLISWFEMGAKKGYLYPAFEVNLDETEWTFDQELPSFLQVSGYFQSERARFVHKASKLTFQISVHIIPDSVSTRTLDSIQDERFQKVYNNLYHSYNAEYMQSSYYMIFEPRYYLILDCSGSMTTAENEHIIKEFVDGFSCIGTAKLDQLAGYPLHNQANVDSLRLLRLQSCERNNPKVKKGEIYVDHLLLLDLQLKFSFARWEKEMMIDENMLYTEEDLALADAQLYTPQNVTWLQPFMPDHYFNVRSDSYKSLRRHIHRTKPNSDYQIKRMTQRECRHGTAFLIASEDTVRLFNIHLREDGSRSSYNTYIYRTLPEIANPEVTVPLMAGSQPNEKAWEIQQLTHMADLYLVQVKKSVRETDFIRHDFNTTQLHSIRHPLDAPITFGAPADTRSYDLLVEYNLTERQLERNFAVINGMTSNYTGQRLSAGIPKPQINTAKTKQTNFQNPLLKSPLLVSDYDQDKHAEFTICYVAQGTIVWSESYEMLDTTFVVVAPEKIRSYLYERVEIYEMCFQSSKYKEGASYHIAAEWGMDYDGYPVVEEIEMGAMNAYSDYPIAVEEAPVMAGYIDFDLPSKKYAAYECDQPASFVGGEKAMKNFIAENMKRPNVKLNSNLVVYVTCNILGNGAVQVESAMNDNGKTDEYTAEAKRLAASMPRWTPALKNGQPVIMEKLIVIPFDKN